MSEILIVDDQPWILKALVAFLKLEGHQVRVSAQGQEALVSARANLPDLVLLDINMPMLDGYETCQAFKADPGLAQIPIVFMSGMGDSLDTVKAFSVGGVDYINKPFDLDVVLARLNHQLRIADLERVLVERNRKLEEARVQLQTLIEQKNHFLGIVAHDLRNPLNSIVLAGQLLEGERDPAEVDKTSRQIWQVGMEMSTLIGRLLEIAAIESGEIKAKPAAFDLVELIQQVILWHANRAQEKGIRLCLAPCGQSGTAYGDPRLMKEILDNLVSNALKFSPPTTSVAIGITELENGIRVSVQDEGPGFTPEDLEKIFSRYQPLSARPTAGEKSTGLGLYIVKGMAGAMGARLSLENAPGKGAIFHVDLPREGS